MGSERSSRLTRLLAATLLTGLLPAQEVPTAEELRRRFAEGSDLIQLRYRRADDGRMQVAGPGADASDWRFLFGEDESLGKGSIRSAVRSA